jgi:hypothetical protein
MVDGTSAPAEDGPWLLLIHQLPPQPAYLRVKVWRRLQGLGAVAVKNSVYVLPATEQAQEDLRWLLREIVAGGGEASICEARFVDGLTDRQVRGMFDAARAAEYDAIADEARALAEALAAEPEEGRAEAARQLARLRRRLAQAVALDFFGAGGREAAEGLLSDVEARLTEGASAVRGDGDAAPGTAAGLAGLRGRTWVTRRGVEVDRIASAWLIRRFIDPEARFKFVPSKGYAPQPGELRFDMFEAEFTHESDRCTFEVLLARGAGLDGDPALRPIGELVHDVDLKDGRFGREETAGIAHLIRGIVLAHDDDAERLARGAAVLDDLYEYFRNGRG